MEIETKLHALKCAPYDTLVSVVSDPEFIQWFMAWFRDSVSASYSMSAQKAACVLKAFLVASHSDRVVPSGILMHVVTSTALEVVKRLEGWYDCPHVIGMCSAIDMFLSTWENHQRSLAPYDTMASVIQTRFWYSHARWATNARLLEYFRKKEFTLKHFRTMTVSNREDVFQSGDFERKFNIWMRRVSAMVVHKTGNSGLSYRKESMSLWTMKMCMLAQMQLVDSSNVTNATLIGNIASIAAELEPLVDECLCGDYSRAESMLAKLLEFGNVLDGWWRDNRARMKGLLENHIYTFTHMCNMVTDMMVGESTALVDLKKRYSYLMSRAELNTFLYVDPTMRALEDAMQSPMWKAFYTSAQVMHELLIDTEFKFKSDECYPILTKQYADALPVSVDGSVFQQMMLDIMAATMHSCKQAADGARCVDVFRMDDIRRDVSFLWGSAEFHEYASRVFNFMRSRFEDHEIGDDFAAQWQSVAAGGSVGEIMLFLFRVAKGIRVERANVLVDLIRSISLKDRLMIASRAVHQYDRTRQWLRDELALLTPQELELVRAGEPFMLVRFHDRAVVNVVCGDVANAIPEILEMDVRRIDAIRGCLSLIDDTPTMRYVLCELATSGRAPRSVAYNVDPALLDAAGKLRAVLTACRVAYGEMTMRLTRSLASEMVPV